MKAKESGHATGSVIECGLYRMHRGSTEGCRVVTLVMQTVHVTVDKLAYIRNTFNLKGKVA